MKPTPHLTEEEKERLLLLNVWRKISTTYEIQEHNGDGRWRRSPWTDRVQGSTRILDQLRSFVKQMEQPEKYRIISTMVRKLLSV